MNPIGDIEALGRVSSDLIAACGRLSPSALDGRTPCDEWTVTQLLDHMTGGNRFTISILGGASASTAMHDATASFGDAHDPVAALAESTQDQLAEFDQPGVLDRTCDHVVGAISATEVIRLRVQDLVIHTWDLNQATGANLAIDPLLGAWSRAELADPNSLTAASLDLSTRLVDQGGLLVAFGRRRDWSTR